MRWRLERAERLGDVLEAIGPGAVLGRGYTWTTGPGGGLVRSVRDVSAGERVTTRLADGSFTSRVEGAGAPAEPIRAPDRPRRRRRRPADDPPQMDLFGEPG